MDCVVLCFTDRGSIAKTNSKGLRGHPWRVPLDKGKYCEHNLLVTTAAFGDEYSRQTQEINVGPNPNLPNTAKKYPTQLYRMISPHPGRQPLLLCPQMLENAQHLEV